MNIVMEPGASMLTDTFLNEIDLSEAGDVSSGSEALLIEPDKPVDPVGSLAVSIPLSASPLAVFSYSNYSVVYTAFDYKNNRKIAGVMPYDQIKIEGKLARFNVNYFGMYQVIKTEAKITKEVSSETKSELNSKRDVKRMEQISLAPASLYYKSDSALVVMNFQRSQIRV